MQGSWRARTTRAKEKNIGRSAWKYKTVLLVRSWWDPGHTAWKWQFKQRLLKIEQENWGLPAKEKRIQYVVNLSHFYSLNGQLAATIASLLPPQLALLRGLITLVWQSLSTVNLMRSRITWEMSLWTCQWEIILMGLVDRGSSTHLGRHHSRSQTMV